MKKYMFITTTLSNGGAERVISILASSIAKLGHETYIVKYYEVDNEYPVDRGVKIINLSGGDLGDYQKINYLEKVKRLRKIIKDCKPDFVMPFLFHVALCTDLAAKGLKTTVIQSIRINPALGPGSKVLRKIRDHLVYKSKCTFVQNRSQKEYFKASHHDRIHVLFNPVLEDLLNTEWRPSKEQYIVCGVGRLESQKNLRLLMDSFMSAFSDIPEAVLRIYGDGSQAADLKTYAECLNMGDRIQMMGRSNDVKSVYQSASLYVLSSDFEGMPNALIEAMAVGVPSISTDCPTGPADLINDGENGILVPVNDRGAMAQAMKRMYKEKDRLESMSHNAKKTIRSLCSADQIAKKLITICESLS